MSSGLVTNFKEILCSAMAYEHIRILPKDMSSLLFPEIGLNHVLGINARCYGVFIFCSKIRQKLFLNTHPAFHCIY